MLYNFRTREPYPPTERVTYYDTQSGGLRDVADLETPAHITWRLVQPWAALRIGIALHWRDRAARRAYLGLNREEAGYD